MVSEVVRVSGHIIDSLILPKVLDEIMDLNGTFEILQMRIGKRKTDTSEARLRIHARAPHQLDTILKRISRLGAVPEQLADIQLMRASKEGVFPTDFYSTTNLPTEIRYRGRWRAVRQIEMDCGIVVIPGTGRALCTPMANIRKGAWVVCGREGIKVIPLERTREPEVFQFMGSAVSSEKPKTQLIHRLAAEMRAMKRRGQKILVSPGPR